MERSSPAIFWPSMLLMLVSAVHGAVLALRLPARLVIADELAFGRAAYALAGFALVQGLSLSVWGALSDRFGRKNVILYSLGTTAVVAVLGYSPLIGWRIPPQFIFSVFNGLCMAGLVLALSYSFSLIKEGRRHLLLGQVVAGFFLGILLMLLFRQWSFSLPWQAIMIATASAALVSAGLTWMLVSFFLPEARATSVSFTGMNALHGLWHGFAESNRASHARWWRVLLGLSGLISGLLLMSLWGSNSGGQAPSTSMLKAPLVFLGCAAVFAYAVASLLAGGRATARLIAVASAVGLLLAAGLLLLKDNGGPFFFLAAGFGGAATGASLVVSITHFAATARQRSAGAELGAVITFWIVGLLGGVWLTLVSHKLDATAPPRIAVFAATISVFLGFMATRRANGS